jgi:branched-chain amino acid aminotransferase
MSGDNIVYLNGTFEPEGEAKVLVTERGFFGGDGVYEVTRTFGHKLFRLDGHLDRLFRSLAYVRIDIGLSWAALTSATQKMLERNLGRLDAGSDFALWHVITTATMRWVIRRTPSSPCSASRSNSNNTPQTT